MTPETIAKSGHQVAGPAPAGPAPAKREKTHFPSGDTTCAAWHYPGTNGGCVIMAGGLAVNKEPGTDLFARRFHAAGFTVLAFDYRHLGESGGQPRQIVPMGKHRADWQAAIEFARTLPEVAEGRLAIWGFSASGGHMFPVAAGHPELAAAIAQAPLADGAAAAPNALRHTTPGAFVRLIARGLLDSVGARLGREPLLVPLAGAPGTVASLTTPDAIDGDRALNPDNIYPDWKQEVAARWALRAGFYRPGRHAARIKCPILVLAYEDDQSAVPAPAIRAAKRAPRGELLTQPGSHYAAFLDGHEQTVQAELSFLRRHLLGDSQ
jgi:uncharacterized protein